VPSLLAASITMLPSCTSTFLPSIWISTMAISCPSISSLAVPAQI
jgi:hypothetical protein